MKTPPQLSEAGLQEIAKPYNLFPLVKKKILLRLLPIS
jgi:hypothetical protein